MVSQEDKKLFVCFIDQSFTGRRKTSIKEISAKCFELFGAPISLAIFHILFQGFNFLVSEDFNAWVAANVFSQRNVFSLS